MPELTLEIYLEAVRIGETNPEMRRALDELERRNLALHYASQAVSEATHRYAQQERTVAALVMTAREAPPV